MNGFRSTPTNTLWREGESVSAGICQGTDSCHGNSGLSNVVACGEEENLESH